ncbi:PREDICTED: nik-related protein kinase, partial [Bison bison bison]|uniref:non-specific serine/threonine protein kinase n=1 Tax=Bison bison bison TaxID=43346 RepID=A0A6P3IXV7_BISBB
QRSVLEQAQKPIDIRQRSSQNPQNCPAASGDSKHKVPDGFKVGKISPPVYLTNEWVGYNALSEIFRNDWLTPAPVVQPPEEDGDYVELYDAGADTDGDDDSNDAYEDSYDHDNGSDELNDQLDQANDVGEDHYDDDNDEVIDDKGNNPDDASSWPSCLTIVLSFLLTLLSSTGKCGFYKDQELQMLQNLHSLFQESGGRSEASNAIAPGAAPAVPDAENDTVDISEVSTESGFSANHSSPSNDSANADFASAILYAGLVEVPEKSSKRPSDVNVNPLYVSYECKKPLIHMYEKEFTSEICCGSLWGVNLLLGTRSNLYLMDRSGKADITKLIKRRPFRQIQVVEPLNLLITISGRKNRLRVYHLTWLRNKILNDDPESKRRQEEMLKTEEACKSIDKLTGCEHFSVLQHEETTYIAIALKSSIHLYAWAPKSFDENTAIKVCIDQSADSEGDYMSYEAYIRILAKIQAADPANRFKRPDELLHLLKLKVFPTLGHKPVTVDLAIGSEKRLKIFFSSADGYHIIDAESEVMSDVTLPNNNIIILPDSLGIGVMLTFNAESLSVEANEQLFKNILDVWKDIPSSIAFECSQRTTGWGQKAMEVRSSQSRVLESELKRRSIKKLRFLCTRGDKLFFTSILRNHHSRVYFMTLGKLEELQSNYGV